jgi:hypothetical protein
MGSERGLQRRGVVLGEKKGGYPADQGKHFVN